jgi:hypothetical protein
MEESSVSYLLLKEPVKVLFFSACRARPLRPVFFVKGNLHKVLSEMLCIFSIINFPKMLAIRYQSAIIVNVRKR